MKHALLTALITSVVVTGRLPAETTFEAWSYTGTDIYPSAIIATATVDWQSGDKEEKAEHKKGDKKKKQKEEEADLPLGDPNGWIGARILDVPKGAKIKVEVAGDGWLKPSRTEVTVKEAKEAVIVLPKGVFDFDSLQKVRQQKPANLSIKCWINGKELPEQTENVSIRSINECPFAVHFGEDEPSADMAWMFAAYVNENHPWIDGILKEALDAGLVDAFDGYQSGDANKVLQQVYAVWNIMQRHGMRYSDITATPKSKFASAQVVRFLDDSVKSTQANCVDGSVIFASILTKISIKCGLVLVPGHCFLCFDLDPAGELDPTSQSCLGLETTMMGSKKLKPLSELKKLPGKSRLKTEKAESEASSGSFLNAIDTANAVFAEHGEEFDADESPYQIIPIDLARELGIMPIAAAEKK